MAKQSEAVVPYRYEGLKPVESPGTLREMLRHDVIMQAVARVMPKHLDLEKLLSTALMAASRNPTLFKCTQASFLQAAIKAGELGLSLSGTLARGYLVPYYNSKIKQYEVQFQVGYGGLIDIICEPGGAIGLVTVAAVYEDDAFELYMGTKNELMHMPNKRGSREPEALIGAYAIFWPRVSGAHFISYLTRDEIERDHRGHSKAKDDGPWVDHYAAMCKKTAVRAGAQYLPLSKEQQHKIEVSDEEPPDYGLGAPLDIGPPTTQGRQSYGKGAPVDTTATLVPPPEGRKEPAGPPPPAAKSSEKPAPKTAPPPPDDPPPADEDLTGPDENSQTSVFGDDPGAADDPEASESGGVSPSCEDIWALFVEDTEIKPNVQRFVRGDLIKTKFGVQDPAEIPDEQADEFRAFLGDSVVAELKKRRILR